jgi:hypothetical protein
MTRARLRDDPTRPLEQGRVRLRLGDEPPTCTDDRVDQSIEATVNPTITVKMRYHDGFTDDGDKRYVWSDVITDRAVVWATRTEVDGSSGVTVEYATATVLYSGTVAVNETATVYVEDDQYRVVSASPFPDRIEFALMRATDGDVT